MPFEVSSRPTAVRYVSVRSGFWGGAGHGRRGWERLCWPVHPASGPL